MSNASDKNLLATLVALLDAVDNLRTSIHSL